MSDDYDLDEPWMRRRTVFFNPIDGPLDPEEMQGYEDEDE